MEGELVPPPRSVRKPTPFKKRGPRYRYFELNSELRTPICIRELVALGCPAPPPSHGDPSAATNPVLRAASISAARLFWTRLLAMPELLSVDKYVSNTTAHP